MRKLMSIVVALVLCLFSMSSSLTVGAVDVKMPMPVTHDAWFTNAITANNELLLFSCRSTIYEDGSLSIMVSPFVNNPKSKAFSLTFTEPTCVRYTDMDYLFSQNESYSYTGDGGGKHVCYPISENDYLSKNENADFWFGASVNHYPYEYSSYIARSSTEFMVAEIPVDSYYYIDKVVEPTAYEPLSTTFNVQHSWNYHITYKLADMTSNDYFQIYFSPQNDYKLTGTYNFRVLGHDIEVSPKTIGLYDTPSEDEAYHRSLQAEIDLYKQGVQELEKQLAEVSSSNTDYADIVAENELLKQTNKSLSEQNKELMKANETLKAEKGDLEDKYSLQTGVVGGLQAKVEELEAKVKAFSENPYFDVNHDGKINVLDLIRLKAYLLGYQN